ncbi:hypothetical protein DFH27DRAFT_542365 [Peziza echinospora]|nr:hypothetical protein DFH27DRAFT_542365 [Peziza echinospora]
MAEALGITSSIISVLELTKKCITYLKDVADCPDQLQQILNEMLLLKGILLQLDDAKMNPEIENLLKVPLADFTTRLTTFNSKLEPAGGRVSFRKSIIWPFKKAECKELLESVERYKTCFLVALQDDHLKLSQVINDRVGDIQNGLNQANGGINQIKKSQEDLEVRHNQEERQKVLNWLSPLAFWNVHNEKYGRSEEGTGQWFLDQPEFVRWLSASKSKLFCPGIPGAGKTILASIAINHVQKLANAQTGGIAVAYVYFNYKEQNQTSLQIVGSLVRQLSSYQTLAPTTHATGLPLSVTTLYHKYVNDQTPPSPPSLAESLQTLKAVISLFPKVYIILDALDECPEWEYLLDVINEVYEDTQVLSVLTTARPIAAIEDKIKSDIQITIHAQDQDIRKYLLTQIGKRSRIAVHAEKRPNLILYMNKHPTLEPYIKDVNMDLKSLIINTIAGKAEGMFLLAQLHLEDLATKHNVKQIIEALAKLSQASNPLPQRLDDTYDQAMKRIEAQNLDDRELANKVLLWTTSTLRPLSVKGLQHALLLESQQSELDLDGVHDPQLIVTVCGGLVAIVDSADSGCHCRLVHYTAQEYFERKGVQYFPGAHTMIFKACIFQLSLVPQPQDTDWLRKMCDMTGQRMSLLSLSHSGNINCFGAYAYENWRRKIRRPFLPRSSNINYIGMQNRPHEQRYYGAVMAALFGMVRGLELEIRRKEININEIKYRGIGLLFIPIIFRLYNGDEIIQTLLDFGADVNQISSSDWVQEFGYRGYRSGFIFKRISFEGFCTPLLMAVGMGEYSSIVALLKSKDICLTATLTDGSTAKDLDRTGCRYFSSDKVKRAAETRPDGIQEPHNTHGCTCAGTIEAIPRLEFTFAGTIFPPLTDLLWMFYPIVFLSVSIQIIVALNPLFINGGFF